MSKETWIDSVRREWWDDATRTYTAYGPTGTQTSTRAYTPAENAAADAALAGAVLESNKSTIETNLVADQVAMQAIIDQSNAAIRTDPSQEIKDLARAVRRLTRIALEDYSGTE